ncbi:MAG: cupin domain-containing protein [Pseudomonadota bacterium]
MTDAPEPKTAQHLPAARGAPFATRERCTITEVLNHPDFPDASLALAEVGAGVTTERHALDVAEAYLVVSGRGRMQAGDLDVEVAAGDAVLIPAGAPQRITALGDKPLVFHCLCAPRFRPEGYQPLPETAP